MRIFIASYTYIYEHNERVFKYFAHPERLVFVLPRSWRSTKGDKITVVGKPKHMGQTILTWAPWYHSHYPLIRGQLKGWMPGLGAILRKHAKPGDILYSSYEPNLLVTYLYSRLAKKLGMKHVMMSWQNVSYGKRLRGMRFRVTEWLLRKNFEMSAGILFGSRKAEEIHSPYLVSGIKTAIIPQTGVNRGLFHPDPRQDTDAISFLFTATFTARKGVLETIDAFALIAEEFPRARLELVGTGDLEAEVRRRADQPILTSRVTILPWQKLSALVRLYAKADVLVHPSQPHKGWEEQFGLMILQAQACGIPVIATRTGSLDESVQDRVTGILVDPGSVSGIAAAMRELAKSKEMRLRMGKAGVAYIRENFSEELIGKRLENYFELL